MPSRAEQLFQQLHNPASIRALIGQSEDVHFDCKEWPNKDEEKQRVLAKAGCGLTNADGGVLVIGMKAKAVPKDKPDLVQSAAPVSDTSAVKSKVLDLIGQLVEPGIEGINAIEVNDPPGSKSGFVIVHIPASEGSPRRSRKDWKFYQRIGSGTFPMEYFQIADMFGKRLQPRLELKLKVDDKLDKIPYEPYRYQVVSLGLSNIGRGIAKFPSVRFSHANGFIVSRGGIDGNGSHGLPLRPSERGWVVFRGGVDDVIYPDSTLPVTTVERRCEQVDMADRWVLPRVEFLAEISCEGSPNRMVRWEIDERTYDKF